MLYVMAVEVLATLVLVVALLFETRKLRNLRKSIKECRDLIKQMRYDVSEIYEHVKHFEE